MFVPDSPLEEFGVEDPRITPLDGRFYITYVAVSRHGVATALASSDRFRHVHATWGDLRAGEQGRRVVPRADRLTDMSRYTARAARPVLPGLKCGWPSRPICCTGASTNICSAAVQAGIAAALVPGPHRCVFWKAGSSFITAAQPQRPDEVGVYSAGAMLLDHEDPSRILRRSSTPLLTPRDEFERCGFVPERRLSDRHGCGWLFVARLLRGRRHQLGGSPTVSRRSAEFDGMTLLDGRLSRA